MVAPTKRNVQLATVFLEIANRYTCPGWIEYLLWETIQGERDRPFKLLDALPDEELVALRACRDEGKFWFSWQNERWTPVNIDEWRKHADVMKADEICERMHLEAAMET